MTDAERIEHAPKFTPGPWRIEDGNTVLRSDERAVLLLSLHPFGEVELQITAADRALIASAPDLYAALLRARAFLAEQAEADCDAEGYVPNAAMREMTAIDEALARAEGR